MFLFSYHKDVQFSNIEDLHTYSTSWEATAQIISCRMKYTRGGGVFYVAILADQSVRTSEIDRDQLIKYSS
jgi:hypothetical protein